MGQINYDIYVNDDTVQNPTFDERWNADTVYEDDIESRSKGVVHVWTFERLKSTRKQIHDLVSNAVSDINSASTIDEITAAFIKGNVNIDGGPIAGANPQAYNMKYKNYPFTQKGIYLALSEMMNLTPGQFMQVLKFNTPLGEEITDFGPPETSDDPLEWTWYGNGLGFICNMSASRQSEIENETDPTRKPNYAVGKIERDRKLYLRSSDISKVRIYLVEQEVTDVDGEKAYIYCAIFDRPNDVKLQAKIDESYVTQNGNGVQTEGTEKETVYSYLSPAGDSSYMDANGVVHVLNYLTLTFPVDSQSCYVTTVLPTGYYTALANKKDYTAFGYTTAGGSNIYYTGIEGTRNDVFNSVKDKLAAGEEDEYKPAHDTEYLGDLCAWWASDYNLLNPYKRSYYAGKLTSDTTDTIKIHIMSDGDTPDTDPDDYYPKPDPGDETPPDGDPLDTGGGTLTTTYSMGKPTLRLLGNWVWSDSYDPLKIQTNPIENVCGLVNLPFVIEGGSSETISVGGKDSGINSYSHQSVIYKLDGGSVNIRRFFNNFFDYEPYTKMKLYIPFIGFVDVSPSALMGKTVNLKYTVDISDGSMKAMLYGNNQLLSEWDANCAISLPLTSTNYMEKRSAAINAVIGGIGAVASADIAGIAGAVSDIALMQTHFSSRGALGSGVALGSPMKAFIVYDRPTYVLPAGYAHQYGFRCDKTKYLSQCKGYTVVQEASLDGLGCTDGEAKEIERLLKEGVYI